MPPGTESIKIKIKSKLFIFFFKWSLTRINYHRQALGDSPHTVYFPRVLCQLWSPGCASRAWIWHSPRRATTHRRAHVSVIMWCHAVQCTASCDRIWYERVNVFVVALYPSDSFVSFFSNTQIFVYSKLLHWLYYVPLLPRRNQFTHNICSMKEKKIFCSSCKGNSIYILFLVFLSYVMNSYRGQSLDGGKLRAIYPHNLQILLVSVLQRDLSSSRTVNMNKNRSLLWLDVAWRLAAYFWGWSPALCLMNFGKKIK